MPWLFLPNDMQMHWMLFVKKKKIPKERLNWPLWPISVEEYRPKSLKPSMKPFNITGSSMWALLPSSTPGMRTTLAGLIRIFTRSTKAILKTAYWQKKRPKNFYAASGLSFIITLHHPKSGWQPRKAIPMWISAWLTLAEWQKTTRTGSMNCPTWPWM